MFLRALLLSLLLWSHAAFAGTPPWRITETAGTVQVQRAGRAAAAVRGASLVPGDMVTTGADGRAVLVRGQEYVIVAARSRLRLPEEAQSRGMIQMLQDWGRATFGIEKKATPHFGVRTPYLVALVKGTVFTVTADSRGAEVAVEEGRVEVGTPDGTVRRLVDAGLAASILSAAPGTIDVQPVAAAAGGESSGEAARGCGGEDGAGCGPKLDYAPVEVADTVSGPTDGGAAGRPAVSDVTASLPLATALLAQDTSPPSPAPSPGPSQPPSPAPDPAPAPDPGPPADPAPGTGPAVPTGPAPGNPASPGSPATPGGPGSPTSPGTPGNAPADPGNPTPPAGPNPPSPPPTPAPNPPAPPPPPADPGNSGPAPQPAPGPSNPPETSPPAPAPGPATPPPAPETPPPAPPPAPAPAPTPETLPPAPAPAPTPETLPPAPAPAPTPETLPPAPAPGPACQLIQLLVVCL